MELHFLLVLAHVAEQSAHLPLGLVRLPAGPVGAERSTRACVLKWWNMCQTLSALVKPREGGREGEEVQRRSEPREGARWRRCCETQNRSCALSRPTPSWPRFDSAESASPTERVQHSGSRVLDFGFRAWCFGLGLTWSSRDWKSVSGIANPDSCVGKSASVRDCSTYSSISSSFFSHSDEAA
jgi:hypothetical protein